MNLGIRFVPVICAAGILMAAELHLSNPIGLTVHEWGALGCKNDPREMNADVKVSFPEGLITEWYPQADYQVFQKNRAEPLLRSPRNRWDSDYGARST
jgi:hypothetical protein